MGIRTEVLSFPQSLGCALPTLRSKEMLNFDQLILLGAEHIFDIDARRLNRRRP
jgi:hypothetical protein